MLNIFNNKPNLKKLHKKYESLLSEWHRLSSIDRSKSDTKYAEAQKVYVEISKWEKLKP